MMASDESDEVVANGVRSDLQRLIEALDRRVPQMEQLGEGKIAADAAQLKAKALRMIKKIDDLALKP